MNIKIPVENNVETIFGDIFVKCEVRILPISPPRTVEGRCALQQLEVRMQELSGRLAYEIIKEIDNAR